MSTQHQPRQHPTESLHEAGLVCRELSDIVLSENEALTNRDITTVDEKLKRKGRLATKLGVLLQEVKDKKDVLKEDKTARAAAISVQEDLDAFQNLTRKNMMLLKAAHQTRADTLKMIRHALNENQPQAETYNARGEVKKDAGSQSLVNKAI